MLKHAIAPARFFSQTPNDLIRHPRLTGCAVRLLQWALSLPDGSRETLTSLAAKMPEGRTTIRNARRQLEAEGYVHTRRRQDLASGRWTTQVLVSNVPLTDPTVIDAAFHGTAPTSRIPTLGAPASRAVGGSTKVEKTLGNTPNHVERGVRPRSRERAASPGERVGPPAGRRVARGPEPVASGGSRTGERAARRSARASRVVRVPLSPGGVDVAVVGTSLGARGRTRGGERGGGASRGRGRPIAPADGSATVSSRSGSGSVSGGRTRVRVRKRDVTMPPERVRAAALLTDLGSHDPRLSLSVLDVARLTPLAARWLASGLPDTALHTALTASLPPLIHSPAALLTHRLRTEPPLPPQPPRPHHPSGPLPECTSCRDPLPRNSSAHHCHRCASVPVPLAT